MNKALLLFGLQFLMGCATTAIINEDYTSKDPDFQKSYKSKKSDCLVASEAALKEMGAVVDIKTDSTLVTHRYDAYQFSTTSGNVIGGSVYASTQVNRQQGKIYVNVKSENTGCKVIITKFRVWNNGLEYDTLNVDFVKLMAVKPFFKELDEHLNN